MELSQAHRPATPESLHSIGTAAEAAGITPQALRMWEERYGRPVAVRLPSGHRRYTDSQVTWLRRVATALALGHRPSQVVGMSEAQLSGLLDCNDSVFLLTEEMRHVLEWTRGYRSAEIRSWLASRWDAVDCITYLETTVAPLLTTVGRAWADGQISIRHEHFLTQILEDELRARRAAYRSPSSAPCIVFATLPNELHALGIQMTALIATSEGIDARMLGVDTPLESIANTAIESNASAVAISVSSNLGGSDVDRMLKALSKLLPPSIALVAGGAGVERARRRPRGVSQPKGLRGWQTWVQQHLSRAKQ